jgi:hypothetical protein
VSKPRWRVTLELIHPVERVEPFDHSDRAFQAKFDGFRGTAVERAGGFGAHTAG